MGAASKSHRHQATDDANCRPTTRRRFAIWSGAVSLIFLITAIPTSAQTSPTQAQNLTTGMSPGVEIEQSDLVPTEISDFIQGGPDQWTSKQGLTSTIKIMLMLTVLSLAPAILLMTTCFVRIVVVLGLLRQAIGTQQLPPSQVITSLALFMTLLVMAPVWIEIKDNSIIPYTDPNQEMSWEEAWEKGVDPIKRFMSRQIDIADNSDDIWLFYQYLPAEEQQNPPDSYNAVPLKVLLPAFMISELKTAFLIGFQIYLPFLILDIVVASVTISMGMMMLPPVMISLPFKLMLFVLVDGWTLVVDMLLASFTPYS